MKSNHKATHPDSPQQIISHLRELLVEAEKLAEHTEEGAEDAIGSLRSRFNSTQEKIKDFYGSARDRVTEGAKQTDKYVRGHPYESLAIALGIGALLGALTTALCRKREE